ncbi:MAG: glycosyl transferase family 1 [Candidatus Rokubacteria bacterium 13_1_40CM_69_27]|nr:MAG: glycosyl transferase family 1 [Candidatus Rokubacteria bacterium 13_1_40CM_69_27]OLE39897.1 MAG: glycosyl transferase family 1 [Candidatus Rokubacteria bacterium 13_1_20CM_2_70_7]
MKALLLSREYPPHIYGGAGVVVDQLARALSQLMAVEVRCFGEREPQADAKIAVRGYTPWSRLSAGPDGPRFAPALETLSIGLAMARDPVDADVAHAHTWYADMAGLWIRTLHRIPLIVTLHSLEPLRPWKADQLGAGYLLSTWIEKTAVEAADRVIAVSARMREDILGHFAVDPAKVVVIHNGIDPERFRRAGRRDALERYGVRPPYVLFVGRITDQKGIFHLLEAAPKLPAGVQLVLCASAPDTPEIEERLRRAVPLHPNVLWINAMIPVEEVVQLYSHAAVFACPSVYEPFGLINLEAMACETPVVASAVGGILEVVEDGTTGYLVTPGRPDELAAALRRLLDDPEQGRAMGRAGRRRVEEKFSWASVAERTERLYIDAIAEFQRSTGD